MQLEINKELVTATSHIPVELANRLTAGEEVGTTYEATPFGWRFLVPNELRTSIDPLKHSQVLSEHPEPLRPLLQVAANNDCKWLLLDSDGFEIESFPTYEW